MENTQRNAYDAAFKLKAEEERRAGKVCDEVILKKTALAVFVHRRKTKIVINDLSGRLLCKKEKYIFHVTTWTPEAYRQVRPLFIQFFLFKFSGCNFCSGAPNSPKITGDIFKSFASRSFQRR